MRIVVAEFAGMIPELAPRRLPPSASVNALNVELASGEIRPKSKRLDVQVLGKSGLNSAGIYKLASTWLHWTEEEGASGVSVVPAPIADLAGTRVYYTGHYQPKWTDTTLAVTGGGTGYPISYWRLGLPPPNNAPTLGTTGGSASNVTRSYLYTFVTADGEEGPPSAAATATGPSDATWNITVMDDDPPNTVAIASAVLDEATGEMTITTSVDHFFEAKENISIAGSQHYSEINAIFPVKSVTSDTVFTIDTDLATMELVTNGTFDADSNWTKGAGWSIAAGVASASAAASDLEQDISAVDGTVSTYDTSFDVSNYSSGTIQIQIAGTGGTARSADGTYTQTVGGIGSDTLLKMSAAGPATLDIDNVSVKETGASWVLTRESSIQTTGMVRRLYRTDELGEYKVVADVSGLSYNDTKTDAQLGADLESTLWDSAPGDLHSIKAHPNGFFVGASANQLRFTPVGVPYAWPVTYALTLPYTIIGLGLWGSTIVVCTDGPPYLCQGPHPTLMSLVNLHRYQSCVSRESIVDMLGGVMYASPDGLVFVDTQPRLITEELFEKAHWKNTYNPSSIKAANYSDRYVAFYENAGDDGLTSGGFVLDPNQPNATFTELNFHADAAHMVRADGDLFLAKDRVLKQYVGGATSESGYWRSKVFNFQTEVCFQGAEVNWTSEDAVVQADLDAAITAAFNTVASQKTNIDTPNTATFGGAPVGTYTVSGGPEQEAFDELDTDAADSVVFTLYRFDKDTDAFVLHHTEALTDNEPFRMPGGVEADEWYFEISSTNARVHHVIVAESLEEIGEPIG